MTVTIEMPSLGENIDEAEVISVLVSEGDEIAKDDPILELETDKTTFEFPSPEAGTVKEILVSKGDRVAVGDELVRIEAGHEDGEGVAGEGEDEQEETEEEPRESGESRKQEEPEEGVQPEETEEPAERPADDGDSSAPGPSAGPAARTLARELGVRLEDVRGSGRGGRVTPQDVKDHVRARLAGAAAHEDGAGDLPDFTRWGEVRREALSTLRRAAARNLRRAWSSVPHVTHHDRADVRALWNELEGLAEARKDNGAPVTLTSCAVKAVVSAMEPFPRFAATLDPGTGEVILKEYRHIGVAVDTERGLVVPVVRNVDRRSLVEVAAEVADLAHRAREGRLDPEDMRGGVFTVTNLGGIGGTGFTPIVRHPEVAILGLARATPAEEHTWLPLSLSYDHRVIDGADAARFCRLVAELLESPLRLLGRG